MNGGYLWRISEQSLFVPTSGYFWNCMKLPGGLLSWVALFFSQFYFYPWLGATFFITMLLGLWVMVYKAFRLPGDMFPLASLPSSCVLLSVVVLGDLIFTLKLPGFAFAGVLGFASAVGVWWVYRSVSSVFWCMAVLCVAAIAGYPCLGFYALLGVGLCVVSEIAKRRSWWLVALGMALMAFIPVAYFRFVPENRLMAENIYTSGLPRLFSHETSLLIPYAVVALLFATGVVAYYRMGARSGGQGECLWRPVWSCCSESGQSGHYNIKMGTLRLRWIWGGRFQPVTGVGRWKVHAVSRGDLRVLWV